MRSKTKPSNSLHLLTLLIVCTVHSHAFDQGSYFIFDIVESAESEPIKGRLAVPAEALARVDSESLKSTSTSRSNLVKQIQLSI
jgi:hypothetical protein